VEVVLTLVTNKNKYT